MTRLHQVEDPSEETSPANHTGCFWWIKESDRQILRTPLP